MPLLIDNVNTLVWDTKENPIKIQYFDWLLGHNPFSNDIKISTKYEYIIYIQTNYNTFMINNFRINTFVSTIDLISI